MMRKSEKTQMNELTQRIKQQNIILTDLVNAVTDLMDIVVAQAEEEFAYYEEFTPTKTIKTEKKLPKGIPLFVPKNKK